jgi:hypothetical protein
MLEWVWVQKSCYPAFEKAVLPFKLFVKTTLPKLLSSKNTAVVKQPLKSN